MRATWWMLASVYIRVCYCRGCARTDNDGSSARCILPNGFWIGGCAAFQIIHVDVEDARISVDLDSYDPFPLVCALSCMVQSMANITYFFLLVGNNGVSSIKLGMRALPLCYHSFVSAGVWPFVVARAPHHMIRVMLAVPMKRKYPGLQGVVLCVPGFLVDCTLYQKQVYMVCSPWLCALWCCRPAS